MKYTAYAICEPGMDRPCFSHNPPSAEQKKRIAEKGSRVFAFELELPGVVFVDGALTATNVTQL